MTDGAIGGQSTNTRGYGIMPGTTFMKPRESFEKIDTSRFEFRALDRGGGGHGNDHNINTNGGVGGAGVGGIIAGAAEGLKGWLRRDGNAKGRVGGARKGDGGENRTGTGHGLSDAQQRFRDRDGWI